MGRTVFIVILVVATVCALKSAFQRAAVGIPKAVPVVAQPDPAPSALDMETASAPASEAGQTNNAGDQLPELQEPGLETAALAVVPGPEDNSESTPVEAVILKEEENGEVIFQAPDPDDFMKRLGEIVQNHRNTASYDLLALFRAEFDADNKQAILSRANMLPPDQNTRVLLQTALSPFQPAELRRFAAAAAADQPDQNFDWLRKDLDDSDPLVALSILRMLTPTEPTTRTIGAWTPPDFSAAGPSRPN